jgi:uncharacterized protein YggT (Ycf19 family)
MTLFAAVLRTSVADYIQALITVYTLIIIAYVIMSIVFSFGGRVPYSRWSNAVLEFIRSVSEPYLGIFRRLIGPIGPFDLSPLIGLIVLQLVGAVIVDLVR